jgi:hypothetical protein
MGGQALPLLAMLTVLATAGCDDSNDGPLAGAGGASQGGAGGTSQGGAGGSSQGGAGSGQAGNLDQPVTLTPPATPAEGWQFDIPPFPVDAGQEVQDCYFVEVPYDEAVFVNKITVAQNLGSHHMNIFRVKTLKGLSGKPGDKVSGGECWKSPNWSDWPLVMNMQLPGVNDWELPAGVAHRFEPRELLMIQTHFVNATTQKSPLGGKVAVNLDRMPKEKVTDELGTVFATNQSIQICPGEMNKTFEATCKFAKDKPVTVVAANGHFHSRGKQFTISDWDQIAGTGTKFYESTVWDEPPFARDLHVTIPPNGGISYSCEFSVPPDACGDETKQCCFTFGGHVETQEHCNAFIYYYPRRDDTDVNCF